MPGKEWLPIQQAADRLGYSLKKTRKLADQPRPPIAVRIINDAGYRQISASSIDAYLEVIQIRDNDERDAAMEELRRRCNPDRPPFRAGSPEERLSALGASDEEVRALDVGSIRKKPPRAAG